MPKKLPTLAKRFDKAVAAQDHAREMATLQTEIEELRKNQSPELEEQLANLRAQLEAQSGEQDIRLEIIDPNEGQPRQTIPLASIQTLARTLDKDGQITPVILIPKGDRYLLWDGQRRWEAAKYLEWATIRAVIMPMPKDLHRKALLTFIHHEDLNPLDKAEAIVKEVAVASSLETEQIPVLLSTVIRRLERQEQSHRLQGLTSADQADQERIVSQLGLHKNEEKILLSLLELAMNPASVKANLMPMLTLPLDLKSAIRERGLKGAHALALTRLSANNLQVDDSKARKERLEATEHVLDEQLTVAKTRELVRQVKEKYVPTLNVHSKVIKSTTQSLNRLTKSTLQAADKDELSNLQRALKSKLSAVEALIK
ncbi:MAG: ParB/RepB/Spo0J family partition protein [Cyanobacteria bacterium P01_D01_bin.105]